MHKIDRYDKNILRILSEDGRITKSNLAEAIKPSGTQPLQTLNALLFKTVPKRPLIL
ncbi:AsnC family transcriptional regulator [Pseudomonas sp. R76]|uniref:AsnC family transcriptional regulator n=1 Tax=Pseudomonas sp. R76 TaxID=1573711 RepID=UPI000AA4460D|nr:AsnC family transcriptional regulator [Pseudomonas sp. R76]